MKKLINSLFYICIVGIALIFFLPQDYFVAVYSPSILGWLWLLFFLPFTFITFIAGGILNYRNKEWKQLKRRSIVFGTVVLSYAIYWFYVVFLSGN
jgi:hypothetical protein